MNDKRKIDNDRELFDKRYNQIIKMKKSEYWSYVDIWV